MPSVASRNLIVLPHVRITDKIDLGHFFLCSSDDLSQIPKRYHKHVATFANMYRTHSHDISEVGLLLRSRKTNRLQEISKEERQRVDAIVDALAFSSIARQRLLSLASDNFSYTVWSFRGDVRPSEHVSLSNRRFRLNVVENKPHLIQLPMHVHYSDLGKRKIDEELLPAVLRCAYSDGSDDRRLLRAVHWYLRAHSDSGDITDYTRFAMTAIAFEALLNTPDRGGVTSYFIRAIQLLLGESARLESWAKDFYAVRSQVMHGRELPELMFGKHQHNSLLALADIIFVQCVFRILSLRNLWSNHTADQVRRENVERYLVPNKERFDAIRNFRLVSRDRDHASAVENYLHTIQKGDASVNLEDCKNTILAVAKMGLDGLSALSRSTEIRSSSRLDIVRAYRTRFRQIEDAARKGTELGVYQTLQGIPKDAADEWGDAIVRGTRFGSAKLISLDALLSALYELDEIHTYLLYDL